MKEYSTVAANKACRDLAFERNHQLFEDAQTLSRAAYDLLDTTSLDVEIFMQYQILRKKADLKSQEAIEHLKLLNDEFPPMPLSKNNSQDLRVQLQSRV